MKQNQSDFLIAWAAKQRAKGKSSILNDSPEPELDLELPEELPAELPEEPQAEPAPKDILSQVMSKHRKGF